MTLNDMVEMLHPDEEMTVFVFDNETDRDLYRAKEICFDEAVLFAVKSPFSCAFYLDKRFADAEVLAVCPVNGDTVDIIIKSVEKTSTSTPLGRLFSSFMMDKEV